MLHTLLINFQSSNGSKDNTLSKTKTNRINLKMYSIMQPKKKSNS
jgi:hypothetical protein